MKEGTLSAKGKPAGINFPCVIYVRNASLKKNIDFFQPSLLSNKDFSMFKNACVATANFPF